MHLREIEKYSEFTNLQENWNQLLRKDPDNNIYLTWEWISTWWKYFGKESRLKILLAEEDNKILGVAPLMVSVYRPFGFKLRKIEFIGQPKHTDYSDFILTEKKAECLTLFLNTLYNCTSEWDCLEFRGIPETSESLDPLRRLDKPFPAFEERSTNLCPYIPLPNSFEMYCEGLGRKDRKELRRTLKRLKQDYDVDFRRCDRSNLLEDGMKTLFELHQKRSQAKKLPGVFSESIYKVFLLDIAKQFAEKEWLNLSFITANNKPIASLFSFEYNQKFYCYNMGSDPAYSKYGPSNLLFLYLIEDCIRKGLKEFDFMRGDEAYKKSWSTIGRRNIELSKSKGLLGNLYSRVKKSDNSIARKLRNIYDY